MKKFDAVAGLVDENEDIAIAHIEPHVVCHKTAQRVITLAHIGWLAVEQVAHAVIQTKHCAGLRMNRR